jgi:hypothetical protein
MLDSPLPTREGAGPEPETVDAIVAAGPHGAVVLAGITTAIVVALWFAFYLLVFLPRGVVQ